MFRFGPSDDKSPSTQFIWNGYVEVEVLLLLYINIIIIWQCHFRSHPSENRLISVEPTSTNAYRFGNCPIFQAFWLCQWKITAHQRFFVSVLLFYLLHFIFTLCINMCVGVLITINMGIYVYVLILYKYISRLMYRVMTWDCERSCSS